eukprot:875251-Prymnesium_polylepis.1
MPADSARTSHAWRDPAHGVPHVCACRRPRAAPSAFESRVASVSDRRPRSGNLVPESPRLNWRQRARPMVELQLARCVEQCVRIRPNAEHPRERPPRNTRPHHPQVLPELPPLASIRSSPHHRGCIVFTPIAGCHATASGSSLGVVWKKAPNYHRARLIVTFVNQNHRQPRLERTAHLTRQRVAASGAATYNCSAAAESASRPAPCCLPTQTPAACAGPRALLVASAARGATPPATWAIVRLDAALQLRRHLRGARVGARGVE